MRYVSHDEAEDRNDGLPKAREEEEEERPGEVDKEGNKAKDIAEEPACGAAYRLLNSSKIGRNSAILLK